MADVTIAVDLNPFSRTGSGGTLNGRRGNFSGSTHLTVPQIFQEWPRIEPISIGGPLDLPQAWTVLVDGVPTTVVAVHRATRPGPSAMTDVTVYGVPAWHDVALVLDTELPETATVTARLDGGELVAATLSREMVSDTLHVCQTGYPTCGPKIAYAGLWLGHDTGGQALTTDAALSSATPWRLLDAESGAEVASGQLALAKAGSEAHRDGINHNLCDVYAADFSAATAPGRYRVAIDGIGASEAFEITKAPYAEALRLAARYYFYQRSGCEITQPHGERLTNGRTWTRPRNGHPEDGLEVFQTEVLLGRYSEGFGATSIFPALAADRHGLMMAEDAFLDPAAWGKTLTEDCTLTAAALEIAGSGFRCGALSLPEPMAPGDRYVVTVEVDAISVAGPGLLMQPAGAAAGPSTTLSPGTNTITLRAGSAFTNLLFKAYSSTTATVSQITVRRIITNPNAWGGWHDAADWDRRIQHMEAVYIMAELVERFPNIRTLDMNIPESGRTFADAAVHAKKDAGDTGDGATILPDLIHEALWGISLWRRTQGAGGGIIGGVEYSLDGIEGSVSWNPVQVTYAYAEEEWSSYQFAAAAAKLGHVIKTVCGDAVLGQALIDEATAAWAYAETVIDTTPHDGLSGSGGVPSTINSNINQARLLAAGALYRAAGTTGTATEPGVVWDSYNPFSPRSTALPESGAASSGADKHALRHVALDYVSAGTEGRTTSASIVSEIDATFTSWRDGGAAVPMGDDFGNRATSAYPWAKGWVRWGPSTNWWSRRAMMATLDDIDTTPQAVRDDIVMGMWFALGCNPANVSLIQGLGARSFAQPLLKDVSHGAWPGLMSFGPAAGELRSFEIDKLGNAIFPVQADWPRNAAIFESQFAVICSEHTPTSNLLEWLFACAAVDALV